jgi:5-methylcytosine-specific restriction protein B
MVVEEINRGNPAQVFGEMLTLLEADKRVEAEALALSYRRFPGERVYIPSNLYVIGTMNTADRSLALVDLAFRRRFAFEELEPTFGQPWREWVSEYCGLNTEFLEDIERRVTNLNRQIADDRNLGRQFCVGHSYVTPPPGEAMPDGRQWFRRVAEKEISPLLDEYWFDSPETAQQARSALLEGL